MPVTHVAHDLEACTLTMTAEFAAPVERLWELYADPRQLEQVFGPPTYPATFVKHELVPGGESHYFMTSPEGEKYFGWWRMIDVDRPRDFVFDDGFALDDTFANNPDLPVARCTYAFEPIDSGTRATFTTVYSSPEALQQVLDMGVIEGATAALDQVDKFLAG